MNEKERVILGLMFIVTVILYLGLIVSSTINDKKNQQLKFTIEKPNGTFVTYSSVRIIKVYKK